MYTKTLTLRTGYDFYMPKMLILKLSFGTGMLMFLVEKYPFESQN